MKCFYINLDRALGRRNSIKSSFARSKKENWSLTRIPGGRGYAELAVWVEACGSIAVPNDWKSALRRAIASVDMAESQTENRPTETIALTFGQIDFEYTEFPANGTKGATNSVKWNIATSQPI